MKNQDTTMPLTHNIITIVRFALLLASLGVILTTLSAFLGRVWWVFDLFSHFRVYYFALALVLSAGLFLLDARRASLVMLLAGFLNFVLIAPFWIPQAKAAAEGQTYRLLSANVLTSNLQHEKVRQLIEQEGPDFIVLVEVNQPWLDDLALADLGYEHELLFPRDNNFGVAFFSRSPYESARIVDTMVPTVLAELTVDGLPLSIVGVHTWPPLTGHLSEIRDQQMMQIAGVVNQQSGAVIVCGDLNLTSWSHAYIQFMNATGLRDSRLGKGIQPSWVVGNPLIHIPIDHVLVSEGVEIVDRRLGPPVGSDHLPVITDFRVHQ
jgi:endonuclease/exonuclease/phosphatase (EEP) superfamily protein YafD